MAEVNRFRVMIAERNPLVLAALGDMITGHDRFELVQGVQTGAAFLEVATAAQPDFGELGYISKVPGTAASRL